MLLDPTDVDGQDVTLSAIAIKILNGTTETDVALGDLSTVNISGTDYYAYSWLVGPGKTQIQAISTGNLDAADLAYIKATKRPIPSS